METIATFAPQIGIALAIVGAAIVLLREQRTPMVRLEAKIDDLHAKVDECRLIIERHIANGHGPGRASQSGSEP